MKTYLAPLFLLGVCGSVSAWQSGDASEPLIIAGQGWAEVCVGADRKTVEKVLGKAQNVERFSDVYFMDYPDKGIEASFRNSDNTLRVVYFYNGQKDREKFATFQGKTDKGVDWRASPKDVIKAYGTPKANYRGKGWQRMEFDGIDFRWENRVLVRIGVPGG